MDDNELVTVCDNLKKIQQSLVDIDSIVTDTTSQSLKEKMSKLSYIEAAQMHLMMAEVSINAFYTFLKSQGVDVNGHPIQQELKRLEEYKKKVNEAINGKEKPRVVIDKEAASRIINNSISK